jgi:rubredoxin/uncharacterized membrane protein
MKRWQCSVCKYIHTGETPPEKCPVCGVGSEKFVLLDAGADAPSPAADKPSVKSAEKPTAPAAKAPPKPATPPPAPPANLYERIIGFMLQHHAHPVSVHFPNGILPAAVVLFILSWIFGSALFAKAGFINLVFVILALPFVLFSGVIEWQKKYNKALTTIFKIKIMAAALTTTACVISVIWYLINPDVLSTSHAWIFILVNLIMLASAGVAGLIGGKLVFKD